MNALTVFTKMCDPLCRPQFSTLVLLHLTSCKSFCRGGARKSFLTRLRLSFSDSQQKRVEAVKRFAAVALSNKPRVPYI